jgi:hypothetical protein
MIKLSGRAMQIFDTMKANNFNVMKGPGGVYWMESMESGKKIYASNGILEVADWINSAGPYLRLEYRFL